MQQATDLAQQGEGQIVTLIETVFYTLHGGSETCNCQLTGDESVVGFSHCSGVCGLPFERFGSESTSGWHCIRRNSFSRRSTSARSAKRSGGNDAKDDYGLGDADSSECWRASTWEVHPASNFQVCSVDHCDASSTNWVNLHKM
jgi:hypothetical protein